MNQYVRTGDIRILSLYGIIRENRPGLQRLTEDSLLMKCDETGYHSKLGRVTSICFRGANSKRFVDIEVPYISWVSLGKPSFLEKQRKTFYTPLMRKK